MTPVPFFRSNCRGESVDTRVGSSLFFAPEPPGDHAHHRCNGERKHRDDEQNHHCYLSLKFTATSTTTSTGAPWRRAGEKRHCRTACAARSFNPPPSPRTTLTSPTDPSWR